MCVFRQETLMALYRIERRLSAGTPEEIDAAAFRAVACIPHFTGMEWKRSYLDSEAKLLTCYYEAQSVEDIRKHAEMAHIPCDAVSEVVEYLAEWYR